ncbi:MAG: UvrD-helicase domain-containing protein, partial [Pyrinomonadaceae bacterium]|nr:UvrD-helicase domain-containing protein [Pyrinomonadaceae bacterium]
MKHWQQIRKRAADIRAEIFPNVESTEILLNGEEILNRLDILTGIEREKAKANHSALQNSHAIINADYFTLIYNGDLPAWFAIYCQAHEYAHHFLHNGKSHCTAEDISLRFAENDVPTGENRVVGYSSRERKEREADLFAREILLPGDLLRRLFIEENWRSRDFKLLTELPIDFINQQLAHALLIADAIEIADKSESVEIIETAETTVAPIANFSLDESQRIAAHSDKQRLLIEAGPGTGKTRALVGRVLHLLEKNVAPENILALTFSNKAAEEMRTRIAKFAPEAAQKIWLGTFHAFGLEILRKFADDADLPQHFQLLDSIDAQILLEKNLLSLGLEHYKSLHSPTSNLKSIHGGILRAKDELVDVETYERAAQSLFDDASNDDEILAAEKTLEVAKVYRFYDKLLRENGWLDFGDLLFRAV